LGRQALLVAPHRGHGGDASPVAEGDDGAALLEGAVDLDRIPLRGVADIVDAHVVVLAPEEGDGVEALALPEDVARGRLPLALGHYPVLDADALAGVGIGPAGDVAHGVDARGA